LVLDEPGRELAEADGRHVIVDRFHPGAPEICLVPEANATAFAAWKFLPPVAMQPVRLQGSAANSTERKEPTEAANRSGSILLAGAKNREIVTATLAPKLPEASDQPTGQPKGRFVSPSGAIHLTRRALLYIRLHRSVSKMRDSPASDEIKGEREFAA
jgi:hypothetical protein